MEFKVGDKVKIRVDLDAGMVYDGVDVTWDMLDYRGYTAKITKIANGDYHLDIDDGEFYWSDQMFEKVENTTKQTNFEHYLTELRQLNAEHVKLDKETMETHLKTNIGRDIQDPALFLEWLLESYEPAIVLTTVEYDVLKSFNEAGYGYCIWNELGALLAMQKKGYFKNVNHGLTVDEIIDKAVIKSL